MNVARVRTVKLPAFRIGWYRCFGTEPSDNACVLGVSVALHETQAGDAWPEDHNWGATTLRRLRAHEQWILATEALRRIIAAGLPARGDRLWFNRFRYYWQDLDSQEAEPSDMQRDLGVTVDGVVGPKTLAALADQYPGADPAQYWPKTKRSLPLNSAELAAVSMLHPSVAPGHAARAAEANRVLVAALRESGAPVPRGTIHCDSTPEDGAYFVWFASFGKDAAGNPQTPEAADADGAEYYIPFITRTAEERGALESGDPHRMAAAMYANHYFLGLHVPDRMYTVGGREVTGDEANVDEYARGIAAHIASVRAAL